MMVIFLVITGITFAGMKYWPTALVKVPSKAIGATIAGISV